MGLKHHSTSQDVSAGATRTRVCVVMVVAQLDQCVSTKYKTEASFTARASYRRKQTIRPILSAHSPFIAARFLHMMRWPSIRLGVWNKPFCQVIAFRNQTKSAPGWVSVLVQTRSTSLHPFKLKSLLTVSLRWTAVAFKYQSVDRGASCAADVRIAVVKTRPAGDGWRCRWNTYVARRDAASHWSATLNQFYECELLLDGDIKRKNLKKCRFITRI